MNKVYVESADSFIPKNKTSVIYRSMTAQIHDIEITIHGHARIVNTTNEEVWDRNIALANDVRFFTAYTIIKQLLKGIFNMNNTFENQRRSRVEKRKIAHAVNDFNKMADRLQLGLTHVDNKRELIIHKPLLPGMHHDTRRHN